MQPPRRPTWICPWREAILPIGGTSPGLVPNKIRPTSKALRRSTAARGDELQQRVWESLDRAVDGSQYDHEPYCVDGHTEVIVRGGTPDGSRSVSSCSASLHTRYEAHGAVQHSTAPYLPPLRAVWPLWTVDLAGRQGGGNTPAAQVAGHSHPGRHCRGEPDPVPPCRSSSPGGRRRQRDKGKQQDEWARLRSSFYSPSSYPPPCLFLTAPW